MASNVFMGITRRTCIWFVGREYGMTRSAHSESVCSDKLFASSSLLVVLLPPMCLSVLRASKHDVVRALCFFTYLSCTVRILSLPVRSLLYLSFPNLFPPFLPSGLDSSLPPSLLVRVDPVVRLHRRAGGLHGRGPLHARQSGEGRQQ